MADVKMPPPFNVRLDADLRDRLKADADRRFQGVEAMAARNAIETYLNLRDSLGFDFDREIDRLLAGEREAAVA